MHSDFRINNIYTLIIYIMSKKDGLLMTNSNIYGLVNPPPVPEKKLGALKHQDISSASSKMGCIYRFIKKCCKFNSK